MPHQINKFPPPHFKNIHSNFFFNLIDENFILIGEIPYLFGEKLLILVHFLIWSLSILER